MRWRGRRCADHRRRPSAVPASASQSVAGLLSYLKALTAAAPEDKEALDVTAFAPPQPDDTEPGAVQ